MRHHHRPSLPGSARAGALQQHSFVRMDGAKRMKLSHHRVVKSPFRHAVTALAVDQVDSRYLLSGGSEGRVAIYDLMEHASVMKPSALARVSEKAVSSVEWYPLDTGMFVTGGKSVVVWDTSTMAAALTFSTDSASDMILDTSMSPIAASASQASWSQLHASKIA